MSAGLALALFVAACSIGRKADDSVPAPAVPPAPVSSEETSTALEETFRVVPYVFTMDDIPMWYVTKDVELKLAAYRGYFEVLTRHKIRPIIFLNPSGLRDPREWDEMRRWQAAGWVLANHTLKHQPITGRTEEEFFAGVDQASELMDREIPGWRVSVAGAALFRFPNGDWGTDPEGLCRKLEGRGFSTLPMSTDIKDYAYAKAYHDAATTHGRESAEARAAAEPILKATVDNVSWVNRRRDLFNLPADQAEVLLTHSTLFAHHYLDEVLTLLEKKGVVWADPTPEVLKPSLAPHSAERCVPDCFENKSCH